MFALCHTAESFSLVTEKQVNDTACAYSFKVSWHKKGDCNF